MGTIIAEIAVSDFSFFWDTFNLVTVASALISGFLFGWLAFLPFIRLLVPEEGPPPPSARTAFILTFSLLFVVLGIVVTVFYAEQLITETITLSQFLFRAVGRYFSFLVFLAAFSFGVALDVYLEWKRKHGPAA